MTLDPAPAVAGAGHGTAPVGAVPDPDAPSGGRRRRILALLLLVLLALFVLFGVWYLINRKPVTELPIPGIPVTVPHYSYSIYDVVAPTGVAVTPDGSRIYAAQSEGDRQVIGFDASGTPVVSLKPPTAGTKDFVPVYVAVNPTNGDVYVSDRPAATIWIFSADGRFRRAFDPGPQLRGWSPLGLGFDAAGNLFVTNVGAPHQAVHEFDKDGALVRTYGDEGQFDFPNGIAVDPAGLVYVSDSNNGRLIVFERTGRQIGLVRRGVREGDLGLPRGTAIDDAGRVYVTDIAQQGVQTYQALVAGERQPEYVGTFGHEGTADGAFRLPNAVAVDGRSRVYVADWRNNRIQVWSY